MPTLCAFRRKFSLMCLVHETKAHPVKLKSAAFLIADSPSDLIFKSLKLQSTRRAVTWLKNMAKVLKSELPCTNKHDPPAEVGEDVRVGVGPMEFKL